MNISTQIPIDFYGKNRLDKFCSYLSSKLEPLTKGAPLIEWIEHVSDGLYIASNQHELPIFLEKYYPVVRIDKCVYSQELLVNARLIKNESSFTIELKDYGKLNDLTRQRYLIAHEIAHTVFYDTKRRSIHDYQFFPFGSREIEFLCNRIARCLLIPSTVINDKKSNLIPSLLHPKFSLHSIVTLCKLFNVPYHVLLNRLIFDTGYWNCIFLRFRKYENEKFPWKLKERYLPGYLWQNKKAFIASEDTSKSKDNPNRFPSAKGKLDEIFRLTSNELNKSKRVSKRYLVSELNDGLLKTFLNFQFKEEDQITIHYSLANEKYSKSDFLNVCIPL